MKVYFISGLAADKRVFKNIELPEGFEMVHLEWIDPVKDETLSEYALRLGKKIDCSGPFAVVGLSMGGMIAAEISRVYKPACTILISSVPSHHHLPVYFKYFLKLRLHKIVPVSVVKTSAIAKRFFTSETPEDKKVLHDIVRDSDTQFIKWAMHAVLTWNSHELVTPYVHIHGTRDEVLPSRYTRPTHIVKGAGHMMIMSRSQEVNSILKEVLISAS